MAVVLVVADPAAVDLVGADPAAVDLEAAVLAGLYSVSYTGCELSSTLMSSLLLVN